jgi:hypothetical protein
MKIFLNLIGITRDFDTIKVFDWFWFEKSGFGGPKSDSIRRRSRIDDGLLRGKVKLGELIAPL